MILADDEFRLKEQLRFQRLRSFGKKHLNFYRIHLLYFVFTPLIASAIFYASNGDTHVPYNDALFCEEIILSKTKLREICVASMTVTGLNSVLLAPLTRWQQVILFLLMCMGSLTSVSLVTILIRRHFFRVKFANLVEHDAMARKLVNDVEKRQMAEEGEKMHHFLHPSRLFFSSPGANNDEKQPKSPAPRKKKRKNAKLDASMVRKVDDEDLVARTISQLNAERDAEDDNTHQRAATEDAEQTSSNEKSVETLEEKRDNTQVAESPETISDDLSPQQSRHMHFVTAMNDQSHDHQASTYQPTKRRNSESLPRPPRITNDRTFQRVKTLEPTSQRFPRSQTIEFASPTESEMRQRVPSTSARSRRPSTANINRRNLDMYRTKTNATQLSSRHTGFGGFPNPVRAAFDFAAGRLQQSLESRSLSRTNTASNMPGRTVTFVGTASHSRKAPLHLTRTGTIASTTGGESRPAPYINFDAVVGRNSHFHALTSAQADELGGVEYRALNLLSKIVAGYWFGCQFIAVLMAAPYLATNQFSYIFNGDGGTDSTWYTFFNVFSAFSNNGLSLLDSSMVPFQNNTYWPLVIMTLILAGNTAFPIFLRLVIWIMFKLTPEESRRKETLQFLLDHPRRCFLYLFPSHQTWLLVAVLILLNGADWASFLVLDLNNPVIDVIPLRHRVLDGLFQGIAVRAAGFGIVNYSSCAPAVLVLYVIMMYIAVYPLAMSIRSTNVYEEKSMGLYTEEDDSIEAQFERQGVSPASYIAYHARKQLAFDAWWLVAALFLVCIIQRTQIADPATNDWFTVFTVLFELTSAYGTVGLSTGSPVTGTSLCGSFRILSKLILICVMIRGRHRGLPNAIDRAVLLPSEFNTVEASIIAPTDIDSRSIKRQMSRTMSRTLSRQADDQYDSSDTSDMEDETRPTSRVGQSQPQSAARSTESSQSNTTLPDPEAGR